MTIFRLISRKSKYPRSIDHLWAFDGSHGGLGKAREQTHSGVLFIPCAGSRRSSGGWPENGPEFLGEPRPVIRKGEAAASLAEGPRPALSGIYASFLNATPAHKCTSSLRACARLGWRRRGVTGSGRRAVAGDILAQFNFSLRKTKAAPGFPLRRLFLAASPIRWHQSHPATRPRSTTRSGTGRRAKRTTRSARVWPPKQGRLGRAVR